MTPMPQVEYNDDRERSCGEKVRPSLGGPIVRDRISEQSTREEKVYGAALLDPLSARTGD